MTRKHRYHAGHTIIHHQRIAGERDETLLAQPLLIQARITKCRIGETRNASLCDPPDLAMPDRNA